MLRRDPSGMDEGEGLLSFGKNLEAPAAAVGRGSERSEEDGDASGGARSPAKGRDQMVQGRKSDTTSTEEEATDVRRSGEPIPLEGALGKGGKSGDRDWPLGSPSGGGGQGLEGSEIRSETGGDGVPGGRTGIFSVARNG